MKYLALIQARCGSTRLPNKVMKDLVGKPLLQRMIERVKRSKLINEIIVVTSIEKNNLPILKMCAEIGIRVGVGSENDVLDRFYQTAKLFHPEYIIRLTADCPCFDPDLLDLAICQMDASTDYMGMLSESFADGLDFEIMKYGALQKAWEEARHTFEREHVTQYILRHPELFKLQNFESPIGKFGEHRWTVDQEEDFLLVEKIYEYFFYTVHKENFGYKEILEYLEKTPKILDINSNISRNEGLKKSIDNDKTIEK